MLCLLALKRKAPVPGVDGPRGVHTITGRGSVNCRSFLLQHIQEKILAYEMFYNLAVRSVLRVLQSSATS